MILFDTDVLIDVSREVPEAEAVLARAEAEGRPAISVVTRMELAVGCRDNRELASVRRFLRRFDVVQINERVSARAAALVEAHWLSHTLRMPDALIAATAIETGLPLVSKNQKDFRFIPDLTLLPYP